MDETGVLSNDPNQRFFALGLLKLSDTSSLFEKIKQLRDKYQRDKSFEFKFNNITKNADLPLHQELIDICLTQIGFNFMCIVVDKYGLGLTSPTSTWDMQISLAKRHIESNVKADEQIAIIADYLTKPKASTKYFEHEMKKCSKVFNACMLESDSSAFVQIVDILIGAIVYSFKIEHGLVSPKTPKAKMVSYIENKLIDAFTTHHNSSGDFKHHKKLAGAFTIFEPFYFNVYKKRKKK